MEKIILFCIFFVLYSQVSKATIDGLFIKSLKESKKVEIINLTNEKTLSDLESISSKVFPTLDLLNVNKYGNNGTNNLSNKNDIDTQLALSLNQKLFQGSEFAISEYKKLVPRKAKSQKELALAEYYGQFATLYFQLSSALEERRKIEALLNNLQQRVSIVKRRTKIGRDRKADFYALESQLYRLKADLITSRALVESAETNFLNFSGLVSTELIKDSIEPLSLSLSKDVNLQETPNLTSLKLEDESSQIETRIEASSRYPQVDLGLNYFIDKSSLGRNDWEVSLNIKLNIFDFGNRSSQIKSKKITSLIKKAEYNHARLNSAREWNNFVDHFESKKMELTSLKNALKRSQASYEEQIKDLEKGLITQLDVIRSLDDVVSLEKLSIKSSLEIKSLYYQGIAYLGNYPKG